MSLFSYQVPFLAFVFIFFFGPEFITIKSLV